MTARRTFVDLLRRCALVGAGGLVGVLAAELFLRMFVPQVGTCQIGMRDPELHDVLRPNQRTVCVTAGHTVTNVRTNALGFRQADIEARHPGVCRILVLGDSTTFGMGVGPGETIPAVLERILNDTGNRQFDVINAGVPGYGTAEEWLVYRRWADILQPDIIVLLFLVTNDVQDNLCDDGRRKPCFELDGGMLRKRAEDPRAAGLGTNSSPAAPMVSSHLVLLLQTQAQNLLVTYPALARLLASVAPSLRPRELPPTIVGWYGSRAHAIGWPLTEALLDALWTDTHSSGVPLILGILPSRPQTTDGYASVIEALYADRPEAAEFRADPERPQRLLTEWADRHGVAVVNPLPALSSAADKLSLNVPDGHFSSAANAIIAQEIAPTLRTCHPRQ